MADIGSILFVDFLRMTAYPGSPFTGNIIQDLVMFFFIPSLILIAFFWVIVTRVPLIGTHRGLKILFSLALFFFLVFQGWYSVIASSMAFYLIILIIAGVFWFIGGHGNQPGGGGGADHTYPGRGYPGGGMSEQAIEKNLPGKIREVIHSPSLLFSPRGHGILQEQIKKLNEQIAIKDNTMRRVENKPDAARAIADLERQRGELEAQRNHLELILAQARGQTR